MKRKDALTLLRVAGYHNDQHAFMRAYIENRVSFAIASEEFRKGELAKRSGMPCTCFDCRQVSP